MLFTRNSKHWGVLHFERLGFLIPSITVCVFVVAAAIAIVSSRHTALTQTYEALNEQLRGRISFIQGAAEEFIEIGRQARLQQLISSLAADIDLISIHIVDERGLVLASSRLADIGTGWQSLQQDFQEPLIESVRNNRQLGSYHDVEHDFIETYASLCATQRSDSLRVKECGFIVYRIDVKPHLQAATLALRDNSTYYLLGMAAVVLISLGLIHVLVARRTAVITSVIRMFRGGDRAVRIDVERNDEISDLGHAINRLFEEIEEDEKEIRDGHERLHALFDNVTESVIVINEEGLIENANPATEKIFGYAPDELIGRNVSVLMPDDTASEHDSYLGRYRGSRQKRIVGTGRQVEARHKAGHRFPVELAISEMHVHGERLFTGILRDISEQVELNRKMQQAYEDLRKAHARLEETARTDNLTGIFNRGHFDTTLATEVRRATRHGIPLSLMLVDVDYFKRYNDNYGHLQGDYCLQQVAKILQQTFLRGGEVVARYGGEEFAVILPHCSEKHAANRAETLLNRVREKAIPHEKSGVADHVTVSIGVATHYPESRTPIEPEDLVKAADEMLYNAKAAGRNEACHTLFEQPTDVGAASAANTRS